ncbi:hypothetical protein TNIN_168611 [Trichonephila inaurata madagascariensis]|uniref:Transposase n=1 Tax=Trichonephila inaurata madagascariensis TaxID=2747483 RepID=A0A8X6YR65_9ARAC|nr:hypothetical protein TNIN_168611 [Trichonephila inaurata madagascariensis]
MAFALQNSTIEEQRSVIRFLTAEGEKPGSYSSADGHRLRGECVSDKSVRKWSARFCAGHESVGDDQVRQTLSSRVISSTRWTTTEETLEREALQLGRRTQGHCEGLGLVTATGILGTRNPAVCSSVGSLCSGLWCKF